MRVLVVHNQYSSRVPSGENLAVRDEVHWLRESGIAVHLHEVSNDDVFTAGPRKRAHQAATAIWSLPAQRALARTLAEYKPDLVHVHNLFPLLSASVPWSALRSDVPVVWTVHNRRVTCVIGTNFRDGLPCHECRPGWRLPGVRHACYGGSAVASALTTTATSIFRRVARRRVTAVAISGSIRQWLIDSAGFDPQHVRVKYNGVTPPPPTTTPPSPPSTSATFLFAGYLIDYKGVSLLLDAWRAAGDIPAELKIVGNGPLTAEVRAAAAQDPRITWMPRVPVHTMPELLASCRAVIVPSIWEEPFGRAAAEALAHGRPVITTGTGGLSEIVSGKVGWVTGTDPHAMASVLKHAARHDEVDQRGAAGRALYNERFSPQVTTRALTAIYEEALANRGPHSRESR